MSWGWGRLDGSLPDHPKILRVGLLGLALHVRALCYCFRHLTDGLIPSEALEGLLQGMELVAVVEGQDKRKRLAATRRASEIDWPGRMEAAGLWERTDDGWRIHDYLSYQLTAEEVKALQARQRRAGMARASQANRGPGGTFLPAGAGPATAGAPAGQAQPQAGEPVQPPAGSDQHKTRQDKTALVFSGPTETEHRAEPGPEAATNGSGALTPEQVRADVQRLTSQILRPRP